LAATLFNSKIYLFSKGIGDKAVYVNTEDGDQTFPHKWSGATKVPGGGTTDVALAATSPLGPNSDTLYLFSKGIGDKAVYVNTMYRDKWSGWLKIGRGTIQTTDVAVAATRITYKSTYSAYLFAFMKTTDNRIFFNFASEGPD
jgi:hypothetical protein